MSLSDAGYVALILALGAAIYGSAASALGVRFSIAPLSVSSRNAIYLIALLLTTTSAILAFSFITHDFGLRYVTLHSSVTMPWYYTISAFYAGQEGSLLYWSTLLAIFGSVTLLVMRRRYPALMGYANAIVMANLAFFLVVLVFFANPMARLPAVMPDGVGLNPLLQDPGMLIHPPMLLAGYMSWTIPFSIGIAALATGRVGVEWTRALRGPALAAWSIQSAGLILGGWWAYRVLGWGGYWGWDPVENVAFLPWLTGTAFLHSVMVVERRGKLKLWTLSLVFATYLLAIFGTFIVRSGILSSVHNFAESDVGGLFLGYFAVAMTLPVALLIWRLPRIRDEEGFESVVSRETGFLFNNLLFVSIAFATFWGTVYPMVSEALGNQRLTVGAPFYEKVNGPLFLLLVLLMGVGPLLAWRKTTGQAMWRNLRIPAAVGVVVAIILFPLLRDVITPIAFGACSFVLTTIAQEYVRGIRTRRRNTDEALPAAVAGLISRDRRRYGGYLVHVAVVVLAVGLIGSTAFQSATEVNLLRGESVTIDDYRITYAGTASFDEPGRQVFGSQLLIEENGKPVGELLPVTQIFQNFETQPTNRVAVRSTWRHDLYIFQAGFDDESATFSIFINPLMSLVWVGSSMIFLALTITAWPGRAPARRPVWEAWSPPNRMAASRRQ